MWVWARMWCDVDLSLYMTAHMRKLVKDDGHRKMENEVKTDDDDDDEGGVVFFKQRVIKWIPMHKNMWCLVICTMHLPKKIVTSWTLMTR